MKSSLFKKHAVILIVLALMICIFSSCRQHHDVDLSKMLTEIDTSYDIANVKEIQTADELKKAYGVDPDDIMRFAAELPDSSSCYTEIILIEPVDDEAAGRIKARLNNHLDSLINMTGSYDAEFAAMVEGCKVKETDGILYLVIHEQHDEIENEICRMITE